MMRAVGDYFRELAAAMAASPLDEATRGFLSSFRGMAPMIQTVHILAVSAVMGSIVLIDLRVLGLALRRQQVSEMVRRLMPWTWYALPVLAMSGLVFVFARPVRYANNRVFGMKYVLLLGALALTSGLYWLLKRDDGNDGNDGNDGHWDHSLGRRLAARALAAGSLILWLGVVMAGRWIAYADYIFPPE